MVDQKTLLVGQRIFMDDWRYSDQKCKVREQALKILLTKFGGPMNGPVPKYDTKAIYECANDWVSQGNMHTAGIVKYCEAYYLTNPKTDTRA